jgi:hypothetical protein
MRTEPSWSNHFPKALSLTTVALGTMPSTYERMGDISNQNTQLWHSLLFLALRHQSSCFSGPVLRSSTFTGSDSISPSDAQDIGLRLNDTTGFPSSSACRQHIVGPLGLHYHARQLHKNIPL